MTNQIPAGTKNLSANVPLHEWQALHAAARENGMKFGQFLRSLILAGAEQTDPQAAAQIRHARRQYYGAILLGLFLFTGADTEARTRPQMVRRPAIRREAA